MTPEIKARIDALARQEQLPSVREAAAARMQLLRTINGLTTKSGASVAMVMPGPATMAMPMPGGQPDYFGFTPNYAWSPIIRKFVDTLPGLGSANKNNLGNYIPVAKPDTKTYPGSDYYEIELRQYTQQFHSDLPPTTLRGYVQVNKGTDAQGNNTLDPDPISYLGPFIVATKDRPVRIKFTNKLPVGAGGDLFLPVDETVMGAGAGPDGMTLYKQNRATIHLHGGNTVWISDGTPHQWVTPAGEDTPYPKGVSVQNVPDMPDPGDGSMTFFYSNQQSARLLWFHDHTYGMTRLNVYAGEVGGYLLQDDTEKQLVTDGVIPSDQIPLILQDKTFVDPSTIATTDPTWNWGTTAPTPHAGDLWFPHVYMPNQNPYDITGANAMGRWDYGPWFYPPTTNIKYGPVANPYYDPINAPWEPPVMPSGPATSSVMESFMDTPIVNGTAYPSVTLQPKSYRFRILNGANDRTFNLQMYLADTSTVSPDGRTLTEVKMVPAVPTVGYPKTWPTDGRDGGVPDPATVGPDFVQIGTEGGFLPTPVVVKNQPVDWNRNMKTFTFGNVSSHALLLAPAERADVIIDFSKYAGKTIILYNDSPAAFPANDPRNDYYTGDPDQTDVGGTKSTDIGMGPNTRTIMQIKIAAATPAPAFDMAKLNDAFTTNATHDGVFKKSQDPILVGQQTYNGAYATTFTTTWPLGGFAGVQDTEMTFKTVAGTTDTVTFDEKGIHDEMGGAYDDWGRMSGNLGLEVPGGNAVTQMFIKQSYIDPASEIMKDNMVPVSPVMGDGTQIWKIVQNGVDTHPIHFHLFDVQLINRVGWDGAIEMPDANELGWKETVRVNPLQDTFVALRPVAPKLPFGVPDSIRPLDPTQPIGGDMGFTNVDPKTGNPLPTPQLNELVNFGWEYMWHCHILSHEEMEMMRPIVFKVATTIPDASQLAAVGIPGAPIDLTWTDPTPVTDPLTLGNPKNEIGFAVYRAPIDRTGTQTAPFSQLATALANATAYTDNTTINGFGYAYQVVAVNVSGETSSNVVYVTPPAWADFTITPSWSAGGSITPGTPQGVVAGLDSPAFLISPSTGYHIADVLVDGASIGTTTSVTFLNVQANHTLRADFARNPVTITSSVTGGHGAISPLGAQTVAYGGNITFNMTPDASYHVADVLVDGQSVGAVSTYTFSNAIVDHTIVVSYAINSYTVTSSVTGLHGTISPLGAQAVASGGSVTFNITPDVGYHIVDVLVDGQTAGQVNTYTFSNVTANHTISVSFAIDTFTITPSVSGLGKITPGTPQTVAYGSNAGFVMTPNTNYRVTDVKVDGQSVGALYSYTFTGVTANHTLLATFAPKIAMRMTIYSTVKSIAANRSFRLYGYLRPAAPKGTPVQIQYMPPGSTTWQALDTIAVDASSNFSRTTTPSRRGTYRFRAYFAGDKDRMPVTTTSVSVRVY